MTRQSKKELNKQAILDSAQKLFESQGYTRTSMKQIAVMSDIAVGTLYNYFDSKGAILLTLLQGKVIEIPPQLDLTASNSDEVLESIRQAILSDLSFITIVDKLTWQDVFQTITTEYPRNQILGSNFSQFDQQYVEKISSYLEQKQSLFKQKIDINLTVTVLYNCLATTIIRYIYNDWDILKLNEVVDKQIGFILYKLM